MISLFSFVFYTVSNLLFVSCEENIFNSANSSLNFVYDAKTQFKNPNIILVIGSTGSGKSTLIHYLADDPSKLTAIKSSNGNNIDWIIKDELNPENSSTTSSIVLQTFVPETVIDEQQNVWYEFAGVAEISNATIEIANTVLIKSVIENASNIKIVMVVDYESVKNSHIHCDFDNLLNSTTQLIKSIEHFENSLSLVVTKAPSYFIRNRKIINISEENVKNTTAEFMFKHRLGLLQNGMADDKISLIDALLKQSEDGKYPKISVFWKPDEVGRLSEINEFVKGRAILRRSILENTVYAQIQSIYFNFPLSDKAILYIINYMMDQAVDSFNLQLMNINDRMQNEVNQTIQSMHDFEKMLKVIHIGQSKIENYKEIDAFKLRNLTELFRELMKEIGLQSIKEHELTQIEQEQNYLNVLKSLVDEIHFFFITTDSNINAWQRIDYKSRLNEISEFFEKCETDIKNNIEIEISQIINNISISLPNVDQQLLAALQEKLEESKGIHYKLNLLQTGNKSIESIGNAITLEQKIKQFSTLIWNLNITSIDISTCNQIEQNSLYLNKLMSLAKSQTIIPLANWNLNSSSAINFVAVEYDWYSFLSDVYNFLASYEVQKDVGAYNVADLSNWGESKKSQGLVITTANFENFTQRFTNLTDFVPTPSTLNELNQLIETALKSSLKYRCDNHIAMIEGNFVKSSNIQLEMCPNVSRSEIKRINVFVTDTFYVDSDLNLNGMENVELHILANKWNIVQPTTFRLNGIDGASQAPPTTNGTAGKAGNRGTNSGNFFGVANEIINGNALTIELIGGNGGNGQDGSGNKDINICSKTINYTDYYYPENIPINILITFESESKKKTFTKANMTCSYVKQETSSFFGKKVIYTETALPENCCGVTGTGGAGGLGGFSGYFEFIHSANNQSVLPKFVTKDGINGKAGQNATACRTTGLQKHNLNGIFTKSTCTETMHSAYKTGWNELIQNDSESIDLNDYHCPNNYVTNSDAILAPPRQLPLLISVTIIEYKRFLLEILKNPVLDKIAQETYDTIESNYNISDTI